MILILGFTRTSYSFPRNVRIGGSDVRQLQLGFLLPMMVRKFHSSARLLQEFIYKYHIVTHLLPSRIPTVCLQLFEIRYIWNLIANPMDLSLLKVNVKVIDSRSGVAETSDPIDSAEAAS